MGTQPSVESLLHKIAILMSTNGEATWARCLEELAAECGKSPLSTSRRVLSLYGGAGSLNDIVLHGPEGRPLQSENDDLSRLRSQLHASCLATISTSSGTSGA
jgi:hypothetical protein